MNRVLLTGASGLIGRHAVGALVEGGFEVHAVGRTAPKTGERVHFHEVDLLDHRTSSSVVKSVGASHLLHLAWYAAPGVFWHGPENLDWVGASLSLLRDFAEAGGRRAVVAGTCAEYEWGGESLDEGTTPCIPATLYGSAKDATRRVMEAYAKGANLSLAWGRVFYLYGPGEKSGRLVSDAIAALLARRPFETTDGNQLRDFMHVRDVSGALAALLASGVEGAVNIGSGTAVPVRDILQRIATLTAGHPFLKLGARPRAAGDPLIVQASARRLFTEVGYVPLLGLDDGLLDTVNWWKSRSPA